MALTINGNTPASYGVAVAGWSEEVLTASTLRIDVVAEKYDGDQVFNFGDVVTVADGEVQLFTGKVSAVPIQGSGTSEGQTYVVSDAWNDLEKVVMQSSRSYNVPDGNGGNNVVEKLFSVVSFGKEMMLGDRIREVLLYAIGQGAAVQIGAISAGIQWWRSEYKNQSCAEILREMMRPMPDHLLYMDVRTSPATISMLSRESLGSVSIDLDGGNVLSHSHEDLEDQVIDQVILRYEYQNTVDGVTNLQVMEDSAGGNDGRMGAVIESIEMAGSNAQYEYAPIVAEKIPKEADAEDDILEWLVNHTPELNRIAEEHGLEQVLAVLELANDNDKANGILKYKRFLTKEPERVTPRPTRGTPIEPSDDVDDYPNELIEGTVTDWMSRRYRIVNVVASIAIKDVTNTPGEMVQDLYAIMTQKRTFGSNNYRIGKIEGSVMATNARTNNYYNLVSGTPAEEMPENLAQQILNQYSILRRRGTVRMQSTEVNNTYQLGQNLNLNGGKVAWTSMAESVSGVEHDLYSGETSVTYSPAETMGPQDFIERLRASRRNVYAVAQNRDEDVQLRASGGGLASPASVFKFSSKSGEGKPFLLTARKEGGGYKYNVSSESSSIVDAAGEPYDLSVVGFDEDKTISGTKYIVLEAALTDGAVTGWELVDVDKNGAKEIGFNGGDPPKQNKARLLIGKVEISAGVVRRIQHVETCQILGGFFRNGEILMGFSGHPFVD